MTGQTTDRVQGQLLWQCCPEFERYHELFEQVINKGQVAHVHKEPLSATSGQTYHDVSIFPLEANEIEGAVLRIDDVTHRVQLEEMMLQSAKMASVGGLAAGVAHEINNPLGAMIQSAQILEMAFDTQRPSTRKLLQQCGVDTDSLDGYLQERKLGEYLSGIRTTGGRAAKIVSDLLSFSRTSISETESYDLNDLIEQTLELAGTDYDLRKKYDFRDIEVVCEFAPNLPLVFCDGQQIQQVILNLVRNAAQAMTETDKPSSLVIRSSEQKQHLHLEIEDNGPGIPEKTKKRLFEPFFTTKETGKGTGLGLWLCWSIVVERHNGRIWAEPVATGGTRFVVELPCYSKED
jgi:signal transduction histidine kinase